MSRAWMPMYWADYVADTRHLSRDEHGGYMLLIAHYWHTGSLPDDDDRLARITLCQSQCEWQRLKSVLQPFFDDGWRHKRIDAELSKASEAYKKRQLASEKGHAARYGKAANGSANAMPKAVPMACQSQSQSQSELDTIVSNRKTREARSLAAQAAFDAFWRRWPNKVGKPAAEKAFEKVSGEVEAILLGVDRYMRDKPPDRPWLNPSTFINQRRWEDAPAEIFQAMRPDQPKKISAITQAIMHLEAEINETEASRDSQVIRQIPVYGEPVSGGLSFEDTELSGNPKRFYG
jgi:uncharacterized protein YdaU (DUF1376 family)